jgi:hypothetical protein
MRGAAPCRVRRSAGTRVAEANAQADRIRTVPRRKREPIVPGGTDHPSFEGLVAEGGTLARSVRRGASRRAAFRGGLALIAGIIAEEIAGADGAADQRRELAAKVERSEGRIRRLVLAVADGGAPDAVGGARRARGRAGRAPDTVRAALRRLLDGGALDVVREPDGSIHVRGGLLPAALLSPARETRNAPDGVRPGRDLSCIAGAGFEPTTFGL